MQAFDYVIVGAGSAGCVLANRLSEDGRHTVCLIEAGPPDASPLIHVPLGILPLMKHRTYNWCFNSVPQKHAAGRQVYTPRGRTLGGSSAINGMVYLRGHRLDYDDWAAAGNPGWSYREVLPYFNRSETNAQHGAPYHGTRGPLRVGDVESYSPLVDMLFEAALSAGWRVNLDMNGEEQDGFGKRQATIWRGRRQSTAVAFLNPAMQRKNLTVLTDCLADTLSFEGRRASGVVVVQSGSRRSIVAKREVVLAGGAIGSPLMLMRSGIGNPEDLSRFGIPLLHALPGVGGNVQDHYTCLINHASDSSLPYGLSLSRVPWGALQVLKYALFRTGIFANNVGHACGYVRSRPELDRPDLLFALYPYNRTPANPAGKGQGYSIIPILMRPKARGRIGLTAPGADAAPMIDPAYWSEPEDLDLMVTAMKLGRRLLAQKAWDPVRGPEVLPGPAVHDDAALANYVRRSSGTAYHLCGSCGMGPDPRSAVVDAQLRVHGIEGLRVADASIMPTVPGGNTNAPAIMIGEKAADMILGKAPLPAAQL